MAALWKLPVIYVCEHNVYGEYTPASAVTAGDARARPAALGIPADEVDGQDVRAVYAAARDHIERARRRGGPGFLLCRTYRFHGHHVGDINRPYRSREEEAAWVRDRDPVKIHAAWLVQQRMADAAELVEVERNVRAEVAAGLQFAVAAPYPDPREVTEDVYA